MMPGIGRMKDGVHPAVGLITRGNFPCWCFSELRHYFWQGWGCQAAMEELQGAARGLLGATAPSLLPQGSPGWQGRSRQQRLKSPARGFSGSGQQHGKGNNCCCLPLAAHALGKKNLLFLGVDIHFTLGNSPLARPLLSVQGKQHITLQKHCRKHSFSHF